jgi:hypothetical protein
MAGVAERTRDERRISTERGARPLAVQVKIAALVIPDQVVRRVVDQAGANVAAEHL